MVATMGKTVGIKKLKNEASALLSEVRKKGIEIMVTLDDSPVAVIKPIRPGIKSAERRDLLLGVLDAIESLSSRISESWSEPISAAQAVSRMRR